MRWIFLIPQLLPAEKSLRPSLCILFGSDPTPVIPLNEFQHTRMIDKLTRKFSTCITSTMQVMNFLDFLCSPIATTASQVPGCIVADLTLFEMGKHSNLATLEWGLEAIGKANAIR